MSHRLSAEVWDTALSATEKSVLAMMASFANEPEYVCYASVTKIAEKCSVAPRTVQRTIDKLQESGWFVTIEERVGKTTRYVINREKLKAESEERPLTQSHPRHSVTPDTVSPDPRHSVTPPPTESHPTPDTVSPEPKDNHNLTGTQPEVVRARGECWWQDRTDAVAFVARQVAETVTNRGKPYFEPASITETGATRITERLRANAPSREAIERFLATFADRLRQHGKRQYVDPWLTLDNWIDRQIPTWVKLRPKPGDSASAFDEAMEAQRRAGLA